jgi:hypothetical protein
MLEHGLIKSGYDELDLNLGGGIPRRALVILEVDSNISIEVAMAFLFRVIQAFLALGNVVFFEPPEEVGLVTANKFMKSCISVAQLGSGKFLRIRPASKDSAHDSSASGDRNQNENLMRRLSENITKEQQNSPNKLVLCAMSLGHLQRLGTHTMLEFLRLGRQNFDLSIVISRKSESLVWSSEIVDTCLKIVVINGTLVLRTLYPVSPILAIEVEKLFGFPVTNLIPLV